MRALFLGTAILAAVFLIFGSALVSLAADTINSATYTDFDGNGTIDRIVWEFDEIVTACAFEADDWSVDTAGTVGVTGVTGLSCTGVDGVLVVSVNVSTLNTTGGLTDPVISYVDAATLGSVSLASGNMGAHAAQAATDAAAPLILSARYLDNDASGEIDRLQLTTTTDTGLACTAYAGAVDLTVDTAGEVALARNAADTCATNGTSTYTITLATVGANNITGGVTAPVVDYTQPGNGLEDGGGNDVLTANNISVADGAAPIILLATSLDADVSGEIDRVEFTTTTDTGLACTAYAGAVDLIADRAGDVALVLGAGDVCATNGTSTFTITLATAGADNITGGSLRPKVDYTQPGNGLEDGAGNDVPSVSSMTVRDGAAPIILSARYLDSNSDGEIDRLEFTTTTDIGLRCGVYTGDVDLTVDTAGEVGLVRAAGDTCADNDTSTFTIILATAGTNNTTGGATAPVVDYTERGNGLTDDAGNSVPSVSNLVVDDGAAPLLLASNPADGGSIERTDDIVLTFSEAIDVATFDADDDRATSYNTVWSSGDTVATISPTGLWRSGDRSFTITTASDMATAPNTFGGAVDGAVHPLTYDVEGSSGGGGGGGSTPETYSITLTSPNGGESYAYGDVATITWTSTGSALSYVSLYYTTDGGTTYETIHKGTSNTGSYTWTVPDISSSAVKIYVVGTDLVTNLATDMSDAVFAVGAVAASVPEVTNEAPSTGETGISPVTGEEEEVSEVAVGDYIKGASFTTVYYVDVGLVRRPFYDAQTFFTYQDNFDAIMTVTDATLPTLQLGTPMLPKSGTVLVKIQSDNAVYAVEEDDGGASLRWVASEDVAVANYGIAWSDYIIDLPATMFTRFNQGMAIAGLEVDGAVAMKTRFALSIENPNDDTDGDELTNSEEVRLGTTLDDADTDDDGYPDALEVGTGHDPLTALDSDGDGYPNYLEILHGYDPYNTAPVKL